MILDDVAAAKAEKKKVEL